MQGQTVLDRAGNNTRILEIIRGKRSEKKNRSSVA